MSGGPVRAKLGDLTIMASGDDASLEKAMPLLNVMGSEVYIIQGGAGMGSTVKVCIILGDFVVLFFRVVSHNLSHRKLYIPCW